MRELFSKSFCLNSLFLIKYYMLSVNFNKFRHKMVFSIYIQISYTYSGFCCLIQNYQTYPINKKIFTPPKDWRSKYIRGDRGHNSWEYSSAGMVCRSNRSAAETVIRPLEQSSGRQNNRPPLGHSFGRWDNTFVRRRGISDYISL